MSDELAERPDRMPAVSSKLTREQIIEFVAKPLRMLPPEWQAVAWEFWAGWSHIVPDQLALSIRLRRWHRDDGLTLGEFRAVIDRLSSPEAMARIQFPGQFHAELASAANQAVAQRRRLEEMRRRRGESEQAKRESVAGDIGKIPDGDIST